MAGEQGILRSEEVLDLEEKYLNEQLMRQNRTIVSLRRTRRKRILQRSLALLAGCILMLFGIIDLVVINSLETSFNSIIIFTISEIIAIPLLTQGIILFRQMSIDQEISAAAEELVTMQDSLSQLRQERLRLVRTPVVKVAEPLLKTHQVAEPMVNFEEALHEEPAPVCPECGKAIKVGAKICRNCGHLFV